MPTAASDSATAAKMPISHIVKRDCDVWLAISSSIGAIKYTGIDESTARIAARSGATSDAGATLARTASAICALRSANGRYRSGSLVGFSGRPRYFTSPTTPTIESHGLVDVSPPNLIRLPIGSCPGQKRFTRRSLTTTAAGDGIASASVNVRPASNGMRSVLKNSGDTRWMYARGAFCALVGACPSAL